MSIFITGDTHAGFRRFRKKIFPQQAGLTKDDYVIICGDFGGVWDGTPRERNWLDWLEAKPFTTLFVSGNHENYDLLSALPVETWNGGKVQRVRPSVVHLMRGQVYEIGGRRFFTMGGASSHDIGDGILDPADPQLKQKCRRLDERGALYRIEHLSWWKEELPGEAEYREARENLEKWGWAVDFIITHCCPTSVQETLGVESCRPDALTDFLEEAARNCRFRHWFFGHYHGDRRVGEKFTLLYQKIAELKEGGAQISLPGG